MLPSYVMLDLETTGGSATSDFITEIAAVRVDLGTVTRRWSTLVNPGVPVPWFIQNLTGITNAMVADAPSFRQVADELLGLLEGSVLVAHNASFDHGFLRSEYARLGHDLRVPSLCTVRLSRSLYPQFRSHGLDALIQRHGLHTDARHRAMGDVDMVLAWLAQATAELGVTRVQDAAQELLQPPLGLPVQLETQVDELPDSPGVYLFYGDGTAPLLIASADNLRQRVTAQLQSASRSARERGIVNNTQRIVWRPVAGELGALLLAKRLIAELEPLYGRRSMSQGVVDARALHPWPYAGAVALREHDAQNDRSELHVFLDWRHLATVRDEADLEQLLADLPEATGLKDTAQDGIGAPLDLDVYRLLVKRLIPAGRAGGSLVLLGAPNRAAP